MSSTTVHDRRQVLPVLNLLLAGSAAVLGVVALTSDDVGSFTPAPPAVAVAAADETSVNVPAHAVLIVDEECGQRIRGNLAC